ncbi:MAG: sulfur carrier protein ThiS [Candidatus Gastranaerophilaceae bacterium]|jgi:thiamine biosynthesis protein ThiS
MSSIKIVINGKDKEVDKNSTIQDILDVLKVSSPMVVVEKNLEIISKTQYNNIVVEDADKLEIVGFFGGG